MQNRSIGLVHFDNNRVLSVSSQTTNLPSVRLYGDDQSGFGFLFPIGLDLRNTSSWTLSISLYIQVRRTIYIYVENRTGFFSERIIL